MNIQAIFEKLSAQQNLTPQEMQAIMQACMNGELSDVQIGAFLALMRSKGETVEELTVAASAMMQRAHFIDLGENLIDIVGTGGDGKSTFNVSTVSSFVAAAAGARVAKHGNRSVSSKSGSADLLLQAGFQLQLNDEQTKKCLEECGVTFLFAPHFHPAMQHARAARQQLGIRTFFNLLGPLINPARVKRQVIGVFDARWLYPLTRVLANLGSERALVLHSYDKMDEISISATSDIIEFYQGKISKWQINPQDYGCFHENLEEIVVNSPSESLVLTEKVLHGTPGPARDIVLLNTAAALYCALDVSFEQALDKAKKAIDSGEALARFQRLKELTQKSVTHDQHP
jgi:anthranilate phosphoribosyltransferase